MKDLLIVCELTNRRFAVRPITWEGEWDEKGRLSTNYNYIKDFDNKLLAEIYANNINAINTYGGKK